VATQSEAGREGADALALVRRAMQALPRGRYLLAVSGGRDSMVLLDAFVASRADDIAAVATFDHGTGAAAKRAVAHVEQSAMALQLPVVSGSIARADAKTEAAWRRARWAFLRAWAAELAATIVTAHTRDDQIETVVLRLLRDSGVRGLAGMDVDDASGIVRPMLSVGRESVAAYAEEAGVRWIEDPSNRSLVHQRNRVRLEWLPAFERADPGFAEWCWNLGARAAAWRRELNALIDRSLAPTRADDGTVVLRASTVASFRAGEWAVLWPALAARAGVVMDRRGVERAAAWAPRAKAGAEIPLSGGARIARTAATFVIRPRPIGGAAAFAAAVDAGSDAGNDAGE
jgi:tRNA(Ile)-lysidine synthase